MKKIVFLGVLIALGIATTGCSRGEVSDGSNGVGIGIGMGPNPGPWPQPLPRDPYIPEEPMPEDPQKPDPWPPDPADPNPPISNPPHNPPSNPSPPVRRPRRPPGSHCDRLGCWDPNQPNFVVLSTSSAAKNLVAKYGIPKTSAVRIASAFANVRSQGLNAYLAIGLTERDFKGMMNRQLPSDEAVRRAAGKLGLSEAQSRNLLISMMRSFWAQAANVNSAYWKYCQMGGYWKTDRNRSCSKLHWPGCSPQTGAKLCY